MTTPLRVLMVCLGNICRSPTAEVVLRHKLEAAGLHRAVEVDSAGTGDWHVGQPPDRRAIAHAARRGYALDALRGRQIGALDFDRFDLILVMDDDNLADVSALRPPGSHADVRLLMSYAPQAACRVVADPYMGGAEGFEAVLDCIEQACDGLVAALRGRVRGGAGG